MDRSNTATIRILLVLCCTVYMQWGAAVSAVTPPAAEKYSDHRLIKMARLSQPRWRIEFWMLGRLVGGGGGMVGAACAEY